MKFTQAQEDKALYKEFRELMKKAGVLNKAVWVELTDANGTVTKKFSNPYKQAMKYFTSLSTQNKLLEIVNTCEALYGNSNQPSLETSNQGQENSNDPASGTEHKVE